jgi:hypothetical protein
LKASDAPSERASPEPCRGMGCLVAQQMIASSIERFGQVVAVSGDLLVVGSPGAGHVQKVGGLSARRSGAAYVFERPSGGRFRETARLEPSDNSPRFGAAVAAAPGAVIAVTPEEYVTTGSVEERKDMSVVQLFEREGSDWRASASIRSPAAAGVGIAASGQSLAITGVEQAEAFVSVLSMGSE